MVKQKIKILLLKYNLYVYIHPLLKLVMKIREYLQRVQRAPVFFMTKNKIIKNLLSDKTPGMLQFELTNICNANCIFCGYKFSLNEKKGIMEFSTFKKALDEFISMGGRKISFAPVYGDSLLDPNIENKLKYTADSGLVSMGITTNGIMLAKNDLYKKLIDYRLQTIAVSLADFDKKSYEEIYCVKSYEELIKGIKLLLEYHAKKNSRANITLQLRSPNSIGKIVGSNDFIKYIKQYLGIHVAISFLYLYDNWGGNIGQKDLKGLMRLRKVSKFRNLPCRHSFNPSILFDGSVRLCGCRAKDSQFDELIVGNIRTECLSSIMRRGKNIQLRFIKNILPEPCKICTLYRS